VEVDSWRIKLDPDIHLFLTYLPYFFDSFWHSPQISFLLDTMEVYLEGCLSRNTIVWWREEKNEI